MRNRLGTGWLCFALALFGTNVAAGDGINIVRVEEDWELVVETPDPLQDAPQVSTWMSPRGSLSGEYFGIDFNHAQRSGYGGGGIQTKSMQDANLIEDRLNFSGQNLSVANENIVWTQVLSIENEKLVFSIKNGSSITWGSFGGGDTEIRRATTLGNLNEYSPDVSCTSSGVGYASNRVASLQLKRIRLVTDTGQTLEYTLNRAIQ